MAQPSRSSDNSKVTTIWLRGIMIIVLPFLFTHLDSNLGRWGGVFELSRPTIMVQAQNQTVKWCGRRMGGLYRSTKSNCYPTLRQTRSLHTSMVLILGVLEIQGTFEAQSRDQEQSDSSNLQKNLVKIMTYTTRWCGPYQTLWAISELHKDATKGC